MSQQRAIVIGATSGIGWEVARLLHERGYHVGIVGRRTEKLAEFLEQVSYDVLTKAIDVSHPEEAGALLREFISELGGLDLIVISSGIGYINPELEWHKEQQVIDVNVSGFVAMADEAFCYFREQGGGR